VGWASRPSQQTAHDGRDARDARPTGGFCRCIGRAPIRIAVFYRMPHHPALSRGQIEEHFATDPNADRRQFEYGGS